ncbi:MAG: ATP-binding protein [Candidatus Gracilibacteria bacterium]
MESILFFLTIITLLGTSIASLVINPNVKINRIFSTYLFFTAAWLFSLYYSVPLENVSSTPENITFIARISYATSVAFTYYMLLFLCDFVFPFENTPLLKKPILKKIYFWVRKLLLIQALVIFALSIFTPLVYDSIVILPDSSFTDNFGPLLPWLFVHYGICFITILLALVFKGFGTTGLARRKLLYLDIVYLIFALVVLTTNVILPSLGHVDYYMIGGLASAPVALCVLFIMIQYRFLGIKIIFSKVLRVFIALLLALGLTFVLDHFLFSLVPDRNIRLVCTSIMAILAFSTMYLGILKNFTLGGNIRTFQKNVSDLIEQLKFTSEFKEFTQYMHATFAQKLAISGAEIFMTNEKKEHPFLPVYPSNELTDLLKRDRLPLVTEELEFSDKPLSEEYYKAFLHLNILNAAVCLPLFFRSELIGFLTLGKKRSRDMYFQEEIESLTNLSDYIAIFLMNDLLRHEGEEKNTQLERSSTILELNKSLGERMKNMQNSVQSALAVFQDLQKEKGHEKFLSVEKNLWELDEQLKLKEDILDISKISLEEFFTEEFTSYQAKMQEKEFDFTWEKLHITNESIFADREKLKNICDELLNNAYQFTPNEGKIIMKVEKKGIGIFMDFINTGDGILYSQKKQIFEEGFTTDENQEGMGLSTVKHYLELHNATIEEIGEPGVETHFRIFLPTGHETEVHT